MTTKKIDKLAREGNIISDSVCVDCSITSKEKFVYYYYSKYLRNNGWIVFFCQRHHEEYVNNFGLSSKKLTKKEIFYMKIMGYA